MRYERYYRLKSTDIKTRAKCNKLQATLSPLQAKRIRNNQNRRPTHIINTIKPTLYFSLSRNLNRHIVMDIHEKSPQSVT